MNKNPLKTPILKILNASSGGLSEYDVIQQLNKQHLLDDQGSLSTDSLSLFRIHFMVMNALYQLKNELIAENIQLIVDPLSIQLRHQSDTTTTKNTATNSLCTDNADAALNDYYLNWTHFESADNATVDNLLEQFWKRFNATDQRLEAFAALSLDPDCSWQEIRNQYKQLSQKHHPDKGGDQTTFISIRTAYETLSSYYRYST